MNEPQEPQLPPMQPQIKVEFKYKQFAFKLDDEMTCEPKKVGEYLTDQALAYWAPRQISEQVRDGWLFVTVVLARASQRKVVPTA